MSTIIRVLLTALLLSVSLFAQQSAGTINGRITDSTGALIPGVTVLLTSPAIQGERSSLSDEAGAYRFLGLPPGTYTVKFDLPGFKSVIREGIVVAGTRTVTLPIQLEVSSVAETVMVTGESPVVDVQNATVGVSFDQSLLTNLPNQRDVWAVLAQTPGVQVTRFDVGGSTMGTQTGYRTYGLSGQNWITVDGVATTEGTSGAGMYYDYGAFSEITVQGAANSAEVAVPGTFTNTVMKTGSNRVRGEFYADWEDGSFQGNNLTDELKSQGVLVTDKFVRYNDFSFQLGGPFKQDKFWWFTSLKHQYSGLTTPLLLNDGFTPGGSFSTTLGGQSFKLNYQLNPSNQLVWSMQRTTKFQPHRDGQGNTARNYIEESTHLEDAWYMTQKGQFTSTINSFTTFDSAWLWYHLYDPRFPNTKKTRTQDTQTGAIRGGRNTSENWRDRHQGYGTMSMFLNGLGGTHGLKLGYGLIWERQQSTTGCTPNDGVLSTVDCITLFYANGVPDYLQTTDAPNTTDARLFQNYFFIQDKWQIGRLTLNIGARFDRYSPYLTEQSKTGQGPFGRKETFAARSMPTFNNIVPRFSFVYDLFGDTKTALKASWGRFAENTGVLPASQVNLVSTITNRYSWDGTIPVSPAVVAASRFLQTTGQRTAPAVDPELSNAYIDEMTAGIEHELVENFGLSALWVRKLNYNRWGTINRAYQLTEYAPVNAIDPGPDGLVGGSDDRRVTVYERALTRTTSDDLLTNHGSGANYNTFEVTATKRFSNKWQMITGFDYTRINGAPPISTDPNTLFFTHDHQNTWSYKLIGTYELPRGFAMSGTFNSQKGAAYARTTTFSGSARNILEPNGTIRTRNLRQGSLNNIVMEPNGSYYLDPVKILNLRLEKTFRLGESRSLAGIFDLFNVFNSSTVIGRDTQSARITVNGVSLARFNRPNNVLPPVIFRLGLRLKF